MKIQAIIFDRDGVLLDLDMQAAAAFFQKALPISMPELLQRSKQWGETVGFPRSLVEERAFFRNFWDHLCDEFGLPTLTRQRLHQFEYTTLVNPYPDARPALLAARQKGLKIGVLSNFTLASIEASLEVAGMLDLVDVACAAPVIGVSKPDPRAYLTVTTALAVEPEQVLLFDNKPEHIAGGQALGMTAYLVDRRRNTHDLAQGIICDLTPLPEILQR